MADVATIVAHNINYCLVANLIPFCKGAGTHDGIQTQYFRVFLDRYLTHVIGHDAHDNPQNGKMQ